MTSVYIKCCVSGGHVSKQLQLCIYILTFNVFADRKTEERCLNIHYKNSNLDNYLSPSAAGRVYIN